MPYISVIVPVYKAEKYLNRCVKSVVNQTFTDWELILVEDGSPDSSGALCDDWTAKDKRIRVFHKKNGGASSARNVGLEAAQGQWISFVDSDDWIEITMFETLYKLAIDNNTPMVMCDMHSNKDGQINKAVEDVVEVRKWTQADLLDRFFRVHGESDTHSVCAAIISKQILNDYHFIEGKMNEDIEACYHLARKSTSAVYTNQKFYNYFLNTEGVTNSSFNKKKLDLLDIWDVVSSQVPQYTPQYDYACEMNCKRARFTLLTQMKLNGYDHSDPFMLTTKCRLTKEVRASFMDLMRWKMPISRKVLLLLICI